MKQIKFLILFILIAGCNPNNYEFEYDIIITDIATNLDGLNTVYDDFNSDLPYAYDRMDIYFSTNRKSGGNDFDIIAKELDFSYHSKDDILNLSISNEAIVKEASDLLLDIVNTENNELGPFSFRDDEDFIFMYATDFNDTFKINLVEYTNWNNERESVISDPMEISGINDFGNNLYPSLNMSKNEMFFCSDRNDAVFNIYSAIYNNELSKQTLVDGDIKSLQKETILSSPFDDKCPFIKDDIIVFTSNRENGMGGYDLYFSYFENGSWTAPELFGDNVNSEYDDYRPIVFQMLGFNLMIFSSNRPGGQGGFDLYIVNIDGIIK
ncbi:MAG: hypothetical protein DRJ10_02055 [Bacteroidetes bacterium]|nr:MAG: hypothetical protein DRJ10_02055 [Bacteroidota bacterium]